MSLSRNKLYALLTIACLMGYGWLYMNNTTNKLSNSNLQVCFIKHATGVPCPSCGSTRSVASIIEGDFRQAAYLNPFGFIISTVLVLAPIWILLDVGRKKNTLYKAILKFEKYLSKPIFSIPLVALVLANWVWNISKGL